MARIWTKIVSLLTPCAHDGLTTPVRSFRGAEIWRCELCGGNVLVADDDVDR
jgi:hypothetical protein